MTISECVKGFVSFSSIAAALLAIPASAQILPPGAAASPQAIGALQQIYPQVGASGPVNPAFAAGMPGMVMTRAGLRFRYLNDKSTYENVKAILQQLAAKYPQNAQLIPVGPSDSGDTILGLRVGNGPVHTMVVGTHHGNEYGATEVAMAFAASVAAAPIPGQTVYVVPVLNILGYNARRREEPAKGRTWDPNRDYPGPCVTGSSFNLKSTAAMAAFIDHEGIVTSATLHTFFPAVAYPWGLSTRDTGTKYTDLFKMLATAATVESKYQTGNSTEVIYPADGTYEDYAFWKHGIWSLLFELGDSHSPTDPEVDELVRVNVPGLRRFLEQAPRQRADRHAFEGRCDTMMRRFDRHEE